MSSIIYNYKEWSEEKINLIKNVAYSAIDLSIMLNEKPTTIRNLRTKLGITPSMSAIMTRPRPNKIKRETRECVGKNCSNTFIVVLSSKKNIVLTLANNALQMLQQKV